MNKKVVLSVLSTAVVASMAASAFAAPKDGLYIGGSVNKYYSTDVLLNMSATAKAAYANEVKSITDFNNLVFVDFAGKGASIQEILDEGLTAAKSEALVKEDFAASYAVATVDGSTDGSYDARANVDGTAPGELKVESVSAITTNGVEISFAALTEAKTDATVEVKDNNGATVAVVPQDLAAGATSAAFDFVTPLTTAPVGVWTINGVSFDLNAVKQFNDIQAAVASGNEVTTLAALKAAGLLNIKDENITEYLAAIVASSTEETLADIQTIINQVNEDTLTDAEEKVIVDAVNNAGDQVQLLSALQNSAFKRVNASWIQGYQSDIAAALATAKDSVSDIQVIVDARNNTEIAAADAAATTAAAQNAVTTLIQSYVADDVAPATTKADAIKASQIKAGVFKVKEASTQTTVYSALTALAALDATNLPATALNGNLKAEYLASQTAYKATITSATTVADIKTNIVDDADADALAAAEAAVDALTATSAAADIKAALQKLATVTSHKTGAAKFDMSTVKDASLVAYATEFDANNSDSLAEFVADIATVNGGNDQATYLDTLKNTSSTATQVKDALVELASAVTANATTTAYLDASSQEKLEIAQFIVDNRASLAATLTVAIVTDNAGSTYADAPLKTAIADHTAKVADFNAIGDLATATISDIKADLDTYAYAPYVALTTSKKLAVAEQIKTLTKDVSGTATPLNFGGVDAVTTLKKANEYIDAAIAAAQ